MDEPAEKSEIVHNGVVKMKDVYEAGIRKYYKEKDYDGAIRYFTKAVSTEGQIHPEILLR